jgi:aminoglycoside phosphotransferase (APT) family kinase protein
VTIHHDDVHETNVVVDPRLGRPRLIDWGGAVVSHPFCSMGVTLDRLSGRLGLPVEHPMIMRVADADPTGRGPPRSHQVDRTAPVR